MSKLKYRIINRYIIGIFSSTFISILIIFMYLNQNKAETFIKSHEYGSRYDEKYFKEIKSFNNSGLLAKKELISLKKWFWR